MKYRKGFTVVELLIVVVVIAILAAIVVVAYRGVTNQAHDSAARSTLSALQKKIMLAEADGREVLVDAQWWDVEISPSLLESLKVDVASLSTEGNYSLIVRSGGIGVDGTWRCTLSEFGGQDCGYTQHTLRYVIYLKSGSGKVFVLSRNDGGIPDGISRLSSDDSQRVYLESELEDAEHDFLWMTIAKSSDPVATCLEYELGSEAECEDEAQWVSEVHAMYMSENPVATCLSAELRTGLDFYCDDSLVEWFDYTDGQIGRAELLRSQLAELSSGGDVWDLIVEGGGFTSRSPIDSRFGGCIYAFNSSEVQWDRLCSSDEEAH